METSFPFKSINGDRKYKADGWRDAFRPLFTKGVFPIGDPLKVTAGTGMTVKVSAGFAFIDGVTYHNPSEKTLPITVADGVLNRKDRVLIRINEENREATAVMLDGTLASSPAAPAIVWDDTYKDIALCTVTVNAGTTSMELAHLSDTRLDPAVCGVAAPYTVPDTSGWFDAWETEYLSWLQARQNAFDFWFETLASTLDENAAANLYNLITAHGSNHALDGIDPIPVGSLGGISFKVDQTLTDAEKAKARTNANAAAKSTPHSVTISSASWSNSLYTISLSDITADNAVELLPSRSITAAQLNALQAANIQDNAQAAGSITIKAFGTVPAVDIPMRVIVRGDL